MNVELLIHVAIALGAALVLAFAMSPLIRSFARRVGAMDVPTDDRRMHSYPIPRLGGLAIFIGFMASMLLFGDISSEPVRGILIGSVIVVITGAIDDILDLRWYIKLAGQLLAAVVAVLHGVRIQVFSNPLFFIGPDVIDMGVLSIPVTILWIIGITNAVNLIDGLDGLAVGVSGIASLSMLLIAVVLGDPVVAVLLAALTGGCLGFIPYNLNPARLFMGDSGALFLGFVLSTASIMGLFKFYAIISFAVPFLILGLPIFDTLVAFTRRLLHGKNPMSADRGHVHHKLIDMGLTQKQAVAVLYAISAILGLSAVVLTTSGELRAILLLLAVIVAALINVRLLGVRARSGNGDTPPSDAADRIGTGDAEPPGPPSAALPDAAPGTAPDDSEEH